MTALAFNWVPKTAITPVVVTLICLIPFAGKAFHLDDPLFIWSAKQIQSCPLDFYGFTVNWNGTEVPMAEITKNPPGAAYYIALVGFLLGWREFALHMALLVPSVFAALGMYFLAGQFCKRPALAALSGVLTPAFLVSSTNIMCDTMMLALWVNAAALWVKGIRADKALCLLFAALLIAMCALTKYFGMSLILLLFVYSLILKRKLGIWALFLLIPVVILSGYQWMTHAQYGRGLLLDAADYALEFKWTGNAQLFSKGLVALAFTGGCIITILFYSPLIWSRRVLVGGIIATILFVFSLSFVEKIGEFRIYDAAGVNWRFLFQLGLMVSTGVSLLGLAAVDLWKSRDADSLLLLLWVVGTFVFAGFINWTVNARSILPMVPAAGILLMRHITRRSETGRKSGIWWSAWPLFPVALVSLLVSWADYAWANTARTAAITICKKFEDHNGTIWFQGHWGFQYYIEDICGRAIDFEDPKVAQQDIVIVPVNNADIQPLPKDVIVLNEVFQFAPCSWLATMNRSLGAGFYADVWGPLPFGIGPVEHEKYYAFVYVNGFRAPPKFPPPPG